MGGKGSGRKKGFKSSMKQLNQKILKTKDSKESNKLQKEYLSKLDRYLGK